MTAKARSPSNPSPRHPSGATGRAALAVGLLLAALAGCSTSSPDTISRDEAQRMATVLDAVVLNVRPVVVDGSQSGVGGITGAAVGGIAGSTIGQGRGAAAAGVLGAVAGAVVGNAIERTGTREEAWEILVQLSNGERRAIVQARAGEAFEPGEPVVLINNGGKVRVIRAPRSPGAPAPAAPPASAPAGTGAR